MESNWRWNVAAEGFWGAGYKLAARVLDSAALLMLPDFYPEAEVCDVYDTSDPDQLPVYAYTFDTSVFPGHFPFGFNVDPD